jgi:oligo-1,6-glucosidase
MVFQFEHMHVDHGPGGRYDVRPLDLVELKRVMARWQEGLADVGWDALYWSNHDQARPVSRYGSVEPAYRADSAKALVTVLHLHRGTPYVYQGEELGMTNYPFTDLDQVDDVESRNWAGERLAQGAAAEDVLAVLNARGRDHARIPMQWDAGPNAGFTTGTPWLPVHPDYREVNVAAQLGDPGSVLTHFQRLIRLRRQHPIVVEGDFALLLPDHPSVYAFLRRLDDEELLVLANLASHAVDVEVPPGWEVSDVLLASGPSSRGMPVGHLGPWAARVHRRTRPRGTARIA